LRNGRRARRSFDEMKRSHGVEWLVLEDEKLDLAVIPYVIDEKNDEIRRMGRDLYESPDNLFEGDEIFFLGFPLGIDTGIQNALRPIVRAGIISLIQQDKNFIIDAHVFPGNSGSPVFLKPALIDLKTQTVRAAKFIGIINSYIPYLDTAISLHTKRPRITFEENSGLARVIGASHLTGIFKSEDFAALVKGL
jgi:S1-C subfamily serine protease